MTLCSELLAPKCWKVKEVQHGNSILLVATLVCFSSFPFVESHLEWLVMLESPQTESICNFHPNISPLMGNISETAPANPASGDFWYQVDHTGHTVTLKKYIGSAWAAATETQELTYTWYAQDKDGNPVTFDKTGKVIYLSAAEIDSILTLQCDVSN